MPEEDRSNSEHSRDYWILSGFRDSWDNYMRSCGLMRENSNIQYNESEKIQQKKYIQSYNYNPEKFIFHNVNNEDSPYLGVELEVDCGGEKQENAEYVCNYMNDGTDNVYCKHDGSLDKGFEIVTHPMTLEYHNTLNYDELFKWLVTKEYKSHDTSTCGMHVHVNRSYFGDNKLTQDLCISKLLYLFEKYWEKIELIARRKSNRFAGRFYLKADDSPLDLYAKSKESAKYGAINLRHKNTIEIRIFKGTLNVNTFMNTLEFVNVMSKLAKDTDIYQIQFVIWDKIIDNFSDGLNKYIEERELKQKDEDKKEANSYRLHSNEEYTVTRLPFRTSNINIPDSWCPNYCVDIARPQPRELTDEEQLQRKITDLRQRIRRARNGLETTNLNRELAQLEKDLRDLRRNRPSEN